MQLLIEIKDIRPIKRLSFRINLDSNSPICIVGRNGAGKTTLAKTLMNFVFADTFRRTSTTGALNASSYVNYSIGESSFAFKFDPEIGALSTHQPIPEALKSIINVELPIPHGQRFSYFHLISEADLEIRREIILGRYRKPDSLINFLARVYGDDRFENLLEVNFSKGSCCYFPLENGRYIREDHFSSGEFFLVNLFRRFHSGLRLIFIDEIDISLDAIAQARLIDELRSLCEEFAVNVVFTSHSLAVMQTLREGELLHLESDKDETSLEERSFSYVKSLLFGFRGWDRYMLVEDKAAKLVIQHHINKYCLPVFYNYLIIEVGGAAQVVSLLERNRNQGFLAPSESVIAILDGDQAEDKNAEENDVYCMPLLSLEAAFEAVYDAPDFFPKLSVRGHATLSECKKSRRHKILYSTYLRENLATEQRIVELACEPYSIEIEDFSNRVLRPFLSIE